MNTNDHFKNLFEYNAWANLESLNSLKTVKFEKQKVESIFSHLIISQILWLSRITNKNFEFKTFWEKLTPIEIKTLSERSTGDWLNLLKGKEEKDFEEFYSYKNSNGENFRNKLKDIILHVINHSTYHRGQIAVLVRKADGTPAMTDYIHYKRKISV